MLNGSASSERLRNQPFVTSPLPGSGNSVTVRLVVCVWRGVERKGDFGLFNGHVQCLHSIKIFYCNATSL